MTSLVSIVHDPDAKLLASARLSRSGLSALYSESCFVITDETDDLLIGLLADWGKVQVKPKCGIGQPRRDVLKMTNDKHAHYCDFDRILYWFMAYPSELRYAIDFLQHYDFTIFERTRRALCTHPNFQRRTEIEANGIALKRYGYPADFLTGSRGISAELRVVLSEVSASKGAGVDVEWPLLAKGGKFAIGHFLCEGLEYESDYFGIRRQSEDELINRMDNLREILSIL